jgi:hypothetical protein
MLADEGDSVLILERFNEIFAEDVWLGNSCG